MEKRLSIPSLFRRTWRYLKPSRFRAAAALSSMIAVIALASLSPLAMKGMIDQGIGRGNRGALITFAALLTAIEVFRQGADFLQNILLRRTAQVAVRALRVDLFRHFQRISFLSPLGGSPGERLSRLAGDAQGTGEAIAITPVEGARDILVFLAAGTALLLLQPGLGLVAILSALLFGIPALLIQRSSRECSKRSREAVASANRVLEENLAGHRVIQLFSLEEYRGTRFSEANRELVASSVSALKVQALFDGGSAVVWAMAFTVVLGWGGREVSVGRISAGSLVAVTQYIPLLLGSIRGIAVKWVSLQSGLAAAERVLGILDLPPGLAPVLEESSNSAPCPGELRMEELSFGYLEAKAVLREISALILPGQTVALVGRTGAGKSTLARLLGRLYDPWEGRVRLSGKDLRTLPEGEFRRRVVFLTQEVSIFEESLLENVRLGDPSFSPGEVERVLGQVGARSLMDRLPQGLHTRLLQGGRDLSLGERQLISFARALLRKPELVILDEPTAHVDLRTEARLLGALHETLAGRTAIVIAHRPSTLRIADRALQIDQGRIVRDTGREGRSALDLVPRALPGIPT